jgi:hypothetical protein
VKQPARSHTALNTLPLSRHRYLRVIITRPVPEEV